MLSIRAINYNYTVNKRVITRTISLHSLHILTRFLILLFFFFFILISLSSFLLRIFSFICLFISVQSTRKLLLNVNSISESYNIAFFFFSSFHFFGLFRYCWKKWKVFINLRSSFYARNFSFQMPLIQRSFQKLVTLGANTKISSLSLNFYSVINRIDKINVLLFSRQICFRKVKTNDKVSLLLHRSYDVLFLISSKH